MVPFLNNGLFLWVSLHAGYIVLSNPHKGFILRAKTLESRAWALWSFDLFLYAMFKIVNRPQPRASCDLNNVLVVSLEIYSVNRCDRNGKYKSHV